MLKSFHDKAQALVNVFSLGTTPPPFLAAASGSWAGKSPTKASYRDKMKAALQRTQARYLADGRLSRTGPC